MSVEKGSVMIRYKLVELIEKSVAGNPTLPQPYFNHGYGGESKPALASGTYKLVESARKDEKKPRKPSKSLVL